MSGIADPAGPARHRPRTSARLATVQALYQMEMTGAAAALVIAEFQAHRLTGREARRGFGRPDAALFARLAGGTAERLDALDAMLGQALTGSRPLDRLEMLVRAILRVGAHELTACRDVPVPVAISEYVDVAHAFYDAGQPAFVNGVLDRIARDHPRAHPEGGAEDRPPPVAAPAG